jgi:transposase
MYLRSSWHGSSGPRNSATDEDIHCQSGSGLDALSVVAAVQALRGVSILVAATVVAEVGNFSRFESPRRLMAYLGLNPSEHSSGATINRGSITKTGNSVVRTCFVEAG